MALRFKRFFRKKRENCGKLLFIPTHPRTGMPYFPRFPRERFPPWRPYTPARRTRTPPEYYEPRESIIT